MPGRLRYDDLDLTKREVVDLLLDKLTSMAHDPQNRYSFEVRKRYYFGIPDGPVSSDAGWYVILEKAGPLYVGTAEDLNARLNTENGSRDQFANPQRISDAERNFIKTFASSGLLDSLSVIVISEPKLRSAMGLSAALTKRDRNNVEKMLNLFRERITTG